MVEPLEGRTQPGRSKPWPAGGQLGSFSEPQFLHLWQGWGWGKRLYRAGHMYRALSPRSEPKGRPRKLVRTQVARDDGSGCSLLPARAPENLHRDAMQARKEQVPGCGLFWGPFPSDQTTWRPKACPGLPRRGWRMGSPAAQRAEEPMEWAKGQHPKSLESSGARVTEPVLGLSTSARGLLVRASLSISPALLPQRKDFQLSVISHQGPGFLLLLPTTLVRVTPIHQ